jgi:ferredoxin
MKIVIDKDRCSGHGRCYVVAPELFVDDEAGYGQVRGDGTISDGLAAQAERAVAACPERAIHLEES